MSKRMSWESLAKAGCSLVEDALVRLRDRARKLAAEETELRALEDAKAAEVDAVEAMEEFDYEHCRRLETERRVLAAKLEKVLEEREVVEADLRANRAKRGFPAIPAIHVAETPEASRNAKAFGIVFPASGGVGYTELGPLLVAPKAAPEAASGEEAEASEFSESQSRDLVGLVIDAWRSVAERDHKEAGWWRDAETGRVLRALTGIRAVAARIGTPPAGKLRVLYRLGSDRGAYRTCLELTPEALAAARDWLDNDEDTDWTGLECLDALATQMERAAAEVVSDLAYSAGRGTKRARDE